MHRPLLANVHTLEGAADLLTCPACQHPATAHPVEDGFRVCTRGRSHRISCRHCAEFWARMPGIAGIQEFGRALARAGYLPAERSGLPAFTFRRG